MPRPYTFLWRWSWVLTAPLTLFGVVWLLPATRDARQFLVWHPASMHRSSDVDLNLRQILLARLSALRADLASSWKSRWETQSSPLTRVDLEIAPANLARLNEALPRSGKEHFVRAMLRYPSGDFEKVAVRYRGDSLHHWGLAAKSWLVRTAKDRLIDGQRRWHLVLPRWRSVANYYVNLRMAKHLGLLSVGGTPVDLRINGRQHGGIHLLQSQQDETFLLAHHRTASDLYVGDMTTFDDNFVREVSHGGLWELPWLWNKAAENPGLPAGSRQPLEILFFRLYHGSTDDLLALLDLPAWADFSAYMQLFGCNHMDMGHNWKLLFDAKQRVFVPVLGDGNGLPDDIMAVTAGAPGRDVSITTPLLARLHQNHEFLRLKNAAIARFYRRHFDQLYFTELRSFQRMVSPTLAVFPQIDWIGTVSGQPIHYFDDGDLARRIDRVSPDLAAWFATHRQSQTLRPEDLRLAVVDRNTLRVAIDGYASARLGFQLPAGTTLRRLRVLIHREGGRSESADLTARLEPKDGVFWLDWPLLAQREIAVPQVGHSQADHLIATATYDLQFDGADAAQVGLVAAGDLTATFPLAPGASLVAAIMRNDNSGLLPAEPPPDKP